MSSALPTILGRVNGVMLKDEQVLDQQESDQLLKIAEKLAGNNAIEACCAYGSKVAGYARPDSDYDLLLVLKNYDHIIKYLYEKNDLDVSVLIVDSNALVKDAEKALLGEFVVGRLLHPYEPLINPNYLATIEKRYKKRVVLEELKELVATDPLYAELTIPTNYFLYSKLQKRAKMYPHALYSYVRTYSGDHGKKNLEKSREGFAPALQELVKEGYILINNELLTILEGQISTKSGDKASLKMSNMMRGMFSWLVHTYAGRRTLIFVKQEAKSKLKRRKTIGNLPPELANPRSLLKLEEGIRIEGQRWLKELAAKLNFSNYSVTRRKLGDLHAATTLYTISENGRTEKLVVKHFASIRAVKWTAVNVWAAGVRKFDVDPTSRFRREYRTIRYLRSMGFNTPEIVASVPDKKLLVTRYIEGTKLSEIIESVLLNKSDDTSAITQWGQILQTLHAKGHTLMDTKASNMLLSDNKLYFTDLEQFTYDDDKAWDLACFIYYSMKFTSNEEGARKVVRAFLDGYMRDGNISTVRKALSKKYISLFYPALVLGIITAVRDEMRSYVTSYS
jgi:Kae1-associated kinase Bud32